MRGGIIISGTVSGIAGVFVETVTDDIAVLVFKCCPETLFIFKVIRMECLKSLAVPIALKCCLYFCHGLRLVSLRDFDIPLEAAGHGWIGEVGGADVAGGKTSIAEEDIGFCVKTCAIGVVAHADFCVPEMAYPLDSLDVGGTHVGSRDNAESSAVFCEIQKGVADQKKAAPFDEGDEHVDFIAAGNLPFKLAVELGLTVGPGEKTAARDGSLWAREIGSSLGGSKMRISGRKQSEELLAGRVDSIPGRSRGSGSW